MSARSVHRVVFTVYEFSYGYEGVPSVFQSFEYYGHGFRCVKTVVVHKYYRAVCYAVYDAHSYVGCGKILPVKAVYVPLDSVISLLGSSLYQLVVVVAVGGRNRSTSFPVTSLIASDEAESSALIPSALSLDI